MSSNLNVDPMKKSSIYATFGKYYGEKLYRLLYDCCSGVGSFCYEVKTTCLGIFDNGDNSLFLSQTGEWLAPETNCEQVNECLGISEDGDETLVLNQKGEWISNSSSNVQTLFRKVHVDSATLLASGVTKVEIIPTPGTGKFLHNISITVKKNFNTIAYGTNTRCVFTINNLDTKSGFDISFEENTYEIILPICSDGDINGIDNSSLEFYTQNGNPLFGNSSIDLYITYQIITL